MKLKSRKSSSQGEPLFSERAYDFILGSVGTIIAGVAFGNSIFLIIGLFPLFFAIGGLLLKKPTRVSISRKMESKDVFVGEAVRNTIEVKMDDGVGVFLLADELPEEFELVEGSNFKAVVKGRGEKREELSYRVRCTKRGRYQIGPVKWESRHMLGLRQTLLGEGLRGDSADELEGLEKETPPSQASEEVITVRPRLLDAKKVRGSTAFSKIPVPSGALTKFGLPTMEFKELREYSKGDPFRHINWKATAKASTGWKKLPVINEYEKEGKKQVWMFLDQSSYMKLGFFTSSVFEYALEAVNSLTHYYLREGCMVGFCSYGRESSFVRPGAGKKQYLRILNEILNLETHPKRDKSRAKNNRQKSKLKNRRLRLGESSLKRSVSKCRPYMSGHRPFSVVITRVTKENVSDLREGILEISKHLERTRKKYPIMVVNVSGYGLSAESEEDELAGDILQLEELITARNFKHRVNWISWDPSFETFTKALLRGVAKR